MPKSNSEGPFCRSCGMPLRKPEDFGTEAGGAGSTEYCCHCFRNGTFTEPAIDMRGMIEKCVRIMAEQGIMAQ